MRVNKLYLLSFILMFSMLIIPTINAAQPIDISFSGDTGINVEVNVMSVYTLGEPRFSIIHLFNVSTGDQITNTTNDNILCQLHLRDSQGFELSIVNATPHLDHWDLNGTVGGTNPLGNYAWTVTCQDNTAMVGGYASGYFEITTNGEIVEVQDSIIYIGVLFFIFILSLVFMASGVGMLQAGTYVLWGGVLLIGIGTVLLYGATFMANNYLIIMANSLGGSSLMSGLFLFFARMLKYSPYLVIGMVIYFIFKWRKMIHDATPDGWDGGLY